MKTTGQRGRAFLLAACLLGAWCFAGCGQQGQQAPELLEPVSVKMDTAAVERGSVYTAQCYDGAVIPAVQEAHFAVSGQVSAVHVAPGQMVQQGQVLAELDESDLLEQQQQLQADINRQQEDNEQTNAIKQYDIAIAQAELALLQQQGATAEEQNVKALEVQRLQTEDAQAKQLQQLDMQELQRQLEALTAQTGNNQLISPCTGRVAYFSPQLQTGNQVEAFASMCYVTQEEQLLVSCPEISSSVLDSASRIYARIGDQEYDLQSAPYGEEEYFAMAAAELELDSRFTFVSGDVIAAGVQSGQPATVCVVRNYVEDALTIPVNALLWDEGSAYVYIQQDGKQTKQPVEVGLTGTTRVEILSGLKEGDTVYVQG